MGSSYDPTGQAGFEGQFGIEAAGGSDRGYAALAAGGGYLTGLQQGYGLVSPELGLAGGSAVRWSAGAFYLPRFLATGVAEGGGVDGQVLFVVAKSGGEHGAITLGPRLSVEAVDWGPSSPSVALAQLAFVVRWTVFDSTEGAWRF